MKPIRQPKQKVPPPERIWPEDWINQMPNRAQRRQVLALEIAKVAVRLKKLERLKEKEG